jgi:hypothetical protein
MVVAVLSGFSLLFVSSAHALGESLDGSYGRAGFREMGGESVGLVTRPVTQKAIRSAAASMSTFGVYCDIDDLNVSKGGLPNDDLWVHPDEGR